MNQLPIVVIPAKLVLRESGGAEIQLFGGRNWTPACAGVTTKGRFEGKAAGHGQRATDKGQSL